MADSVRGKQPLDVDPPPEPEEPLPEPLVPGSVTAANVLTRLNVIRGKHDKTEADVTKALAKIDQKAIATEEAKRVRTVVWDRHTPINGVSPERLIESGAVNPRGEVLLTLLDEQIIEMQPFHPETGELMTYETAQSLADSKVKVIADSETIRRTFEKVDKELGLTK